MVNKKEEKAKEWQEYEKKTRLDTFINIMFYDYELSDYYNYTDDENIINKRIEELKEYLKEVEIDETLKENILKCDEFLNIVCHLDITEMLNNEYTDKELNNRFNELATDYDKVNNFFKDKDAFIILNLYGIVEKDSDGNYKINDSIVDEIIKENDLEITDEEKQEEIKDLINTTWENKKEIITKDTLNDYSQKRNGINFKYFVFCEEYIKTGKITDVSKKLNIGRRTCYDYLQKKEVKKYLKERQDEIKEENTQLMKQRYNNCFETLYKMSVENTEYISNNDQIKAIDTFLKHYENSILKQPTAE